MPTFARKIGVLVLMALPLSALFGWASSTAFTGVVETEVVIDEPMADDFVSVGSTIDVTHAVSGDFLAVASDLAIEGTIEQDLLALAGTVSLTGMVEDDARVFAGTTVIDGVVKDDLIVRSGRLLVTEEALISGDLVVFRGVDVEVWGTVEGDLIVRGGNVVLGGEVMGDVLVRSSLLKLEGSILGDSILAARRIEVSPSAIFEGSVKYWSQFTDTDFSAHLSVAPMFDESLRFNVRELRGLGFIPYDHPFAAKIRLMLWLSGFLFLLMFSLYDSEIFRKESRCLIRQPLVCFGLGLLFLLGTPLMAVVLMGSVIALPIGLLLFCLFLFILYLSKILVAMVIAAGLLDRWSKKDSRLRLFVVSALIFVGLKLIADCFLWGPFVTWILATFAFGSMLCRTPVLKHLRDLRHR